MMPWYSALATFFVIWFLALFLTLPFGVRRVENPVPGQELGAPEQPYMWRKIGASALISLIVTAGLLYGLSSGFINFRS
jgi:predicted secreted protein